MIITVTMNAALDRTLTVPGRSTDRDATRGERATSRPRSKTRTSPSCWPFTTGRETAVGATICSVSVRTSRTGLRAGRAATSASRSRP